MPTDDLLRSALLTARAAGERMALDRVFAVLGRTLAAQILPELAPRVTKADQREHGPSTGADLESDPHQALLLAQLDHHIRCMETGESCDKGDRALHVCWDDPDALAGILAPHAKDEPAFAKSIAYALYLKAAERAPKGGISLGAKFYTGGQWIPSSVVASASPEEKTELAERKQGARPNPLNKREKAKADTAERRGTREWHRKHVATIGSDIMLRPDERTPDKYRDLAEAMRNAVKDGHLSVAELRTLRLKLSASFGGGRRKDQMIAALLNHADNAAKELQDDKPIPNEPAAAVPAKPDSPVASGAKPEPRTPRNIGQADDAKPSEEEFAAASAPHSPKLASVDSNSLDSLVANGHREVFRGLPSKDIDPTHDYVGQGDYGPGRYFSTQRHTAEQYASGENGESEGTVVRGAIHPSAKLADVTALAREQMADEKSGQIPAGMGLSEYARHRGYDAIHVPHKGYINVLNPDVLSVEHGPGASFSSPNAPSTLPSLFSGPRQRAIKNRVRENAEDIGFDPRKGDALGAEKATVSTTPQSSPPNIIDPIAHSSEVNLPKPADEVNNRSATGHAASGYAPEKSGDNLVDTHKPLSTIASVPPTSGGPNGEKKVDAKAQAQAAAQPKAIIVNSANRNTYQVGQVVPVKGVYYRIASIKTKPDDHGGFSHATTLTPLSVDEAHPIRVADIKRKIGLAVREQDIADLRSELVTLEQGATSDGGGPMTGEHRGIRFKAEKRADGTYDSSWDAPGNFPGGRSYWARATGYDTHPTPEAAIEAAKRVIDAHHAGAGSATFRTPLFAAEHRGQFDGTETVHYQGEVLRIAAGGPGQFVASNADDTKAIAFVNGDPATVVFGPDASSRLMRSVGAMAEIEREADRPANSKR